MKPCEYRRLLEEAYREFDVGKGKEGIQNGSGNVPDGGAAAGRDKDRTGSRGQAAGEGKTDPVIDNTSTPAAGEKKKRVYNFKKKKCIKCGNVFTPSYGPQKMCRDCALKIADGKITPTTSDKDSKKEAMIIVDKLLKKDVRTNVPDMNVGKKGGRKWQRKRSGYRQMMRRR